MFYLFTDSLIYCKERASNSYLFKGEIKMHLCLVREAKDSQSKE